MKKIGFLIIVIVIVLMLTGCEQQVVDPVKTDSSNPVPQGLRIESRDVTSINLVWNGVAKASGYRIHVSSAEDFAVETAEDIGVANYQLIGLTEGAYRYVRVCSIIDGAESGVSSVLKAYSALNQPTNLLVTPDDNDYELCTIAWNYTGTAATMFRVFRGDNDMSDFNLAGASAYGTNSIGDILNAGNKYYYKVVAYNDNTNSSDSEIKNYNCVANAVANFDLTDDFLTSISFSWSETKNAAGYFLYRSPTQTGIYAQVMDIGSGARGCINEGLTPGTRYYYKAAAYTIINGAKTPGVLQADADSIQGITKPYWPTNRTAPIITSNSITLSWDIPQSGNADGVFIYRYTTKPDYNTVLGGVPSYIMTTFDTKIKTDESLNPNTTYYYILASYVAYLNGGNNGKTYQTGAETDTYNIYKYLEVKTKPKAPANFNVVMNGNTAQCSWDKPNDTGTYDYDYVLSYRLNTESVWTTETITTSNTVTRNIPGLLVGGTYYFKMKNVVDGVDSSETIIITRQAVLSAPESATLSNGSCSYMTLKWEKVSVPSTQTVDYQVYRSANGGAYSFINYNDYFYTQDATSITIRDTSVNLDTEYTYYVRAYVVVSGTNVYSAETYSIAVAHVVPVPGFGTCSVLNKVITFRWSISTDSSGYEIRRDSETTPIITITDGSTVQSDPYTEPSPGNHTYYIKAFKSVGTVYYSLESSKAITTTP